MPPVVAEIVAVHHLRPLGPGHLGERGGGVVLQGMEGGEDIAVRDGEAIYPADRKKEVVVCGAFNVYPREIEDVISGCSGMSA